MFVRLAFLCHLAFLVLAFIPAAVRAGTTGGISGTVVDQQTGKGLGGVRVSLTSPSQIARATTDGNGNFAFVSLAPDTYVLSLELADYDTSSLSGITITSDARQTLTVNLRRSLKTIGKVTSRSAADLVRPGTTADVYSINARQQDAPGARRRMAAPRRMSRWGPVSASAR